MRWPWSKPKPDHDEADCVACQGALASMQVHVFHEGPSVGARIALNANAPALDPRAAAAAVFVALIVHLDRVLGDGAGMRMAASTLANIDELRGDN